MQEEPKICGVIFPLDIKLVGRQTEHKINWAWQKNLAFFGMSTKLNVKCTNAFFLPTLIFYPTREKNVHTFILFYWQIVNHAEVQVYWEFLFLCLSISFINTTWYTYFIRWYNQKVKTSRRLYLFTHKKYQGNLPK